ncbi:2-octaprenyl-6-methoxyphenyl hydroxylase [Pseudoalteromonas sp. MM17-2]|uniref:2-octaprenyl-6-methoxyphenyl hydroxylase n=1 Tax=Pseudoalteromonas sp. MM17-2 TaxID=2917753 RepID=UPI001EF45CAA|nr:2-octaprenyl-6-methoxyphenyl hydroxylase [Pseudoalteromonas sp. MM17-2]
MQHTDVVIVGGGLVGSTLANILMQQCPKLSIAVIEAHELQSYHPSFDDRCIALAADSVAYLQQHQLFDTAVDYASAIKQVQVSDRGHFGKTQIHHHDYQLDALGYVVEVRPWGQRLTHAAKEHSQLAWHCPSRVSDITLHADYNCVTLDCGTQLGAKLVVIADGAQSPTRSLVHIDFFTTQYEQHALIANVQVQGGHHHHAFERFTEHGPIALLPMSQNRYSLVWCDNPQKLHTMQQLSAAEFTAALQQEFGYRAGLFTQVGERSVYPLSFGQAQSLSSHRAVVIGNAAHAIHPIAGQGFNLGLRDIKELAQRIRYADAHSLGNYHFTQGYSRARLNDVRRVMQLTDSLVRLFSNGSRTLALGRSVGLSAMQLCSSLRQPLAKQLMGFN